MMSPINRIVRALRDWWGPSSSGEQDPPQALTPAESSTTDAAAPEPSPTELATPEPSSAEPATPEPSPTQSAAPEQSSTEPAPEQVPSQSGAEESAPVESAPVESAPVESAPADSGMEESTSAQPSAAERPHTPGWESVASWGNAKLYLSLPPETYYREALAELLADPGPAPGVAAAPYPALLLADEAGAVISVAGRHLCRLPDDTAQSYLPVLQTLAAEHRAVAVACSIAGSADDPAGVRVRAFLPRADEVLPPDSLPEADHVVVPTGHKIVVTTSADHRAVLREIVGDRKSIPVAATLHEIQAPTPSGTPGIEVHINGKTVGRLKRAPAEQVRPIVQASAEAGLVAVTRARVEKAERLVLETARAEDLPATWLEDQQQSE